MGRERLESKADMRARGLESPDGADALIGAIMLALGTQGGISRRTMSEIKLGVPGEGLFLASPLMGLGKRGSGGEPLRLTLWQLDLDNIRISGLQKNLKRPGRPP